MKIGTKVVVTAQWSSFYTMRGVVETTPHLKVLLGATRNRSASESARSPKSQIPCR